MQYLTDWRMTLARDHLRADALTIAQIATQTGYASPYAFAAAFRRHHGHLPGQWRRQALARGGVEPPTYRFSSLRSTVHGVSRFAPVLVSEVHDTHEASWMERN